MSRVYFSVRKPLWGSQKSPERAGNDSPGAAGFEPHFCVQHAHIPPLPTASKDVATFSHGAKGLKVQHVQWIDTCHVQKAIVSLVLAPSCFGGFALCGIFVSIPAYGSRNGLGQKRYPR